MEAGIVVGYIRLGQNSHTGDNSSPKSFQKAEARTEFSFTYFLSLSCVWTFAGSVTQAVYDNSTDRVVNSHCNVSFCFSK